jgi:hypothetical protein
MPLYGNDYTAETPYKNSFRNVKCMLHEDIVQIVDLDLIITFMQFYCGNPLSVMSVFLDIMINIISNYRVAIITSNASFKLSNRIMLRDRIESSHRKGVISAPASFQSNQASMTQSRERMSGNAEEQNEAIRQRRPQEQPTGPFQLPRAEGQNPTGNVVSVRSR